MEPERGRLDDVSRVRRRGVFHLPGFDPHAPRGYRDLYRTEAAAQARISGDHLTRYSVRIAGACGQAVTARVDGAQTVARLEVQDFSDPVLMAAGRSIAWVDVIVPWDRCADALCDPVAVCGVASAMRRWLLAISAAFSRTLSPRHWRAQRSRFVHQHVQHLSAFDRTGRYDCFRLTARPLTLAARHAGRASSPLCLRVPVSKFTSLAP